MATSEARVTIDSEHELYVVAHDNYYTSLGFDNCLDEIDRIKSELVLRGGRLGMLDTMPERGTQEAWDTLQLVREALQRAVEESGIPAVAGLSPQLAGLEGWRVEVETTYGERRRFIVGKSTGWMPCHLELASRHSADGSSAEREYKSVTTLEKVR